MKHIKEMNLGDWAKVTGVVLSISALIWGAATLTATFVTAADLDELEQKIDATQTRKLLVIESTGAEADYDQLVRLKILKGGDWNEVDQISLDRAKRRVLDAERKSQVLSK